MDPYTEYLGTGLARREPSYWLPRPSTRPSARRREDHRAHTLRASRWLRRRS
jgi:hypothetical protein